jgi:hypothetical protein
MAAGQRSGQVRVELLGAFRVVVDGDDEFADTVWPSRRSAQLVQLLALAERRCLQLERVDALDLAGRVVRIDLGPLDRGEVAALVESPWHRSRR